MDGSLVIIMMVAEQVMQSFCYVGPHFVPCDSTTTQWVQSWSKSPKLIGYFCWIFLNIYAMFWNTLARLYSKFWPMLSIFDSNKQKTAVEN
jgi:hypothetical protein